MPSPSTSRQSLGHAAVTIARPNPSPGRQGGFTLVEMMISMAIGLVLILGAVTIYANGRQNFQTFESVARLQDEARFALDVMAPDIRLAGFWGRTNEAAFIDVPAGIDVTCAGADVTDWALALDAAVAASDDRYDLPCPAFGAHRPDTDVLVLRHASAQPAILRPGVLQVQSNRMSGTLLNDGELPAGFDPPPATATHDLQVHAYYVDDRSSVGGLPSLRRMALVPGGLMQDEEIIPGVENMQVQLGVDTDEDGDVERYVDPDHDIVSPGAAGYLPTARILAVRLWLIVRSEQPEAMVDDAVYFPPDADLPPLAPTDKRRRMQLATTIFLRNQ
jgi:type IV pilus assembly protein PilW